MVKIYYVCPSDSFWGLKSKVRQIHYPIEYDDYKKNMLFIKCDNIYLEDYNKRIDKKIRCYDLFRNIVNDIIEKEQIHKFRTITELLKMGFVIVGDNTEDIDIDKYNTIRKIIKLLIKNKINYHFQKDKYYMIV